MKVRDATIEDEDAVVALWRACGLVVAGNDPVSDFRLALGGPSSAVLIAEGGETVAGSVMVGHDGHRGWIYYVATHPSVRARGIGRSLVAAAEDWLRARRIPKLQLLIRETNAQVAGFYAKLGFEPVLRINMRKRLDG